MADDKKGNKEVLDVLDVVKVDTYVDRDGRQVKALTPQFVKNKKIIYQGLATIKERAENPSKPARQIPLEFTFKEGTTLLGAFKQFDDMAKEALVGFNEEMKRQQEQQQGKIIAPSGNKPILGLDGKPLS